MIKTITYAAMAALVGLSAFPVHAETFQANVWVDNWFKLYVNDKAVKEDSVSITTERSFNQESFTFSAERPFALNFIVKDFKENDTGLEYIGTNRQQMGDGGFIAQFGDASGKLVAVTNGEWRCLPIHIAPTNKSCEKERNPVAGQGACGFTETAEPAGWKSVDYDDSSWPKASTYSASQVGPKDGYNEVKWVSSAKFIWGSDLETVNTLLCRTVVR